jgi:hypothetical protein
MHHEYLIKRRNYGRLLLEVNFITNTQCWGLAAFGDRNKEGEITIVIGVLCFSLQIDIKPHYLPF